jgi:metal-sulfur cluster biosynthetic enzyme
MVSDAGMAIDGGARRRELWRRLGEVCDPELDDPVTEMGFVERAEVAGDGSVEVDFRLPTYWCSPNFVYLMLDDIQAALGALSWKPAFKVTLQDHMFAEEVNRGLEAGHSFRRIFGELAGDEDLAELRLTFARKAYQRRQEAVLLGFRRQGRSDRDILGMDLAAFDGAVPEPGEAARQKPRYRASLLARWPGRQGGEPAFVTWEGTPIEPDGLGTYLAALRAVRINMEFNGALCRGLKQSRYREMRLVDGEPTLVDFILDRVPQRSSAGSPAGI